MSICSRRYASNSITRLNSLCKSSSPASHLPSREQVPDAHRPLLFLYPQWFQHASARHYHTEHEPGPDRRQLASSLNKSTLAFRTQHKAQPRPCARRQLHYDEGRRNVRYVAGEYQPRDKSIPYHRKSNMLAPEEKQVLTADSIVRTGLGEGRPRFVMAQSAKKDGSKRQYFREQELDDQSVVTLLKSLSSDVGAGERPDLQTTRFHVSKSKIWKLTGTSAPNTWIHHDAAGCLVRVKLGTNGDTDEVEFEGNERAKEIVMQHLTDSSTHDADGTNQEEAKWVQKLQDQDSYADIRSVPRPPKWSLSAFWHYTCAITHLRPRRSAMRYTYQRHSSRNKATGELLEALFTDTTAASFASSKALERALRFCRLHSELAMTARRIWDACVDSDLQPDVPCFNQELMRCLITKDGSRFKNLVSFMKEKKLEPDSGTWALAIRFSRSAQTRHRILSHLRGTHFLESSSDKQVLAAAVVRKETKAYLGATNGMTQLFDLMDTYFGQDWLSTPAILGLLRVCRINKAHVDEASDVLKIVQKAQNANCALDLNCLIELIRIAKKAGNLLDALEIAKSKPMLQVLDLHQDILELLFLLAWQKQYLNICRLLWFRAATSGRITDRMHWLVKDSLQTNVSAGDNHDRSIWRVLAGKMIIGTNLESTGFRTLFPSLATHEYKTSPIEWLCQWTADERTNLNSFRHEQMQLCHLLLERDLNAWRFYQRTYVSGFANLLDKALALDTEWKKTKAVQSTSPRDLLTQTLRISLWRRSKPLRASDLGQRSINQRDWFNIMERKLDYDSLVYDQVVGDIDDTEEELQDSTSWHSTEPAGLTMNGLELVELRQRGQLVGQQQLPEEYAVQESRGKQEEAFA